MSEFDPIRMLQVLTEHRVDFVLIGGMAANVLGSPSVTGDVDVCYARATENLERLAGSLRTLGARLRGVEGEVPFQLDRTLAAGDHFTFTSPFGDIDVMATPSGSNGYEELLANSSTRELDGLRVNVCSLDDLIRMKRAAGRPKDRIELEILGALRSELENDRWGGSIA